MMDDDQTYEIDQFGTEYDTQTSQSVETVGDYTSQLVEIAQCQQISIAMSCLIAGLLLALIVLNVFKRFI